MSDIQITNKRTALALILGSIAGVLVVALFIKTIPSLMDRFMSGMMDHMMSRMKARGCTPSDM